MKALVILATLSFSPAYAQSSSDGQWRHAHLAGADGTSITVDFQMTQYSNGGSSAVNIYAESIWINVRLPQGSSCDAESSLALEYYTANRAILDDGQPKMIALPLADQNSCRYSAQLSPLLVVSSSPAMRLNYFQYFRISSGGRFVMDPANGSYEFQIDMSRVPSETLRN